MMGALLRLDSVSADLARAYREASHLQRRRTLSSICSTAVAQSGLQGDDVDAALAVLENERNEQSHLRHRLNRLATELDENYLKRDEMTEITEEVLHIFRKARAAAALAFALSPDAGELHEALYEAIIASENRTAMVQMAERILRAE